MSTPKSIPKGDNSRPPLSPFGRLFSREGGVGSRGRKSKSFKSSTKSSPITHLTTTYGTNDIETSNSTSNINNKGQFIDSKGGNEGHNNCE